MKRLSLICLCLAAVVIAAARANGDVGLVIGSDPSDAFGNYTSEILKAEGFGAPTTMVVSGLTLSKLQSYSTIVLSDTSLTASQAQLFRDYVAGGGSLIGLRPDSKLDDVFGIASSSGTVSEGYTKISAATPLGTGLETTTSMVTHGVSDCYNVATGATKVASLYSNGSTDTGYASVIQSSYGKGQAVAFSYDLSKSIAYTRQGNPAWAGQEHDGVDGLRPNDLMYDAATNTSWNDNSTRSGILQADEQMRLLTHSIESVNAAKAPIPRLWYFPDAKKSVLVMTGDQDGSSVANMNAELNAVTSRGGTSTLYLLANERPTLSQVNAWVAAGCQPGIHFDDTAQQSSPTWATMNSVYTSTIANFQSMYPGVPLPKTVRDHHLVYCGTDAAGHQDFTAQPEIESSHGIQLDFNYYNWEPNVQGQEGYTISSGLPMKFVTSTGQTLNIFQADTQITDEGMQYQSAAKYAAMLDASINQGKYAWIVTNFHPVNWGLYGDQVQSILDTAKANDIPIWSGEKMNSFLQMRDAAGFQNTQWNGRTLSFLFDAPVSGEGKLTLMLPSTFDGHSLDSISLAGLGTPFDVENIAGADYALFTVGSGMTSISAVYVPEPATMLLLVSGGLAAALWRCARRRHA